MLIYSLIALNKPQKRVRMHFRGLAQTLELLVRLTHISLRNRNLNGD